MWANHYTQNKVIRILLVSLGGDVRKVENDAYLFQSLSCFYLNVRSATSHAPLHYLAEGAGARRASVSAQRLLMAFNGCKKYLL